MAKEEIILDGLAWAGMTERVRVARISAGLVRELSSYSREHTKTKIKQAVRDTCPPYGRGKAICEAVTEEYKRQLPIHRQRQQAKQEWDAWLAHAQKHETRLNRAYAGRFDRPEHNAFSPEVNFRLMTYEERREHEESQEEKDKGDECVALTHFRGHVVCLLRSQNGHSAPHIATRRKRGPVVRTYIRSHSYDGPADLVEAAVALGGPKVRAALALGKRVVTDWVDRLTYIHHDGSDHIHPHVEKVPWRAYEYREDGKDWRGQPAWQAHPILVMGDTTIPDESAEDDETDYC